MCVASIWRYIKLINFDLFISVHQNYVGCDGEKEPFFLSVVLTDANNHNVQQYRAILWRKTVSQHVITFEFYRNTQRLQGC